MYWWTTSAPRWTGKGGHIGPEKGGHIGPPLQQPGCGTKRLRNNAFRPHLRLFLHIYENCTDDMHYYQPADLFFQLRVYIFGIINVTARVMLQASRLPILSPIIARVSADRNKVAVSRRPANGTSHIHTIDETLRTVASATAAGSGTENALHGTRSACHDTECACHDTECACHDTECACHVTESACHVTESACHVTESACHGTRSACHVTGSSCHVTECACHVTESACHGTDAVQLPLSNRGHVAYTLAKRFISQIVEQMYICHGRFYQCINQNTLSPVTL